MPVGEEEVSSSTKEELSKTRKYIERLREEHKIRVHSLEVNVRLLTEHNKVLESNMKNLQSVLNPDNFLPSFVRPFLPPPPAPPPPPSSKTQKIDVETLKEDLERVTGQLKKKEMEAAELRDRGENIEAQLSMSKTAVLNAHNEVTRYKKSVEEMDKELSKVKEWEEEGVRRRTAKTEEVVNKMSNELVKLREQLSLVNLEKDTIKDELRGSDQEMKTALKQAAEVAESLEEIKQQFTTLETSTEMMGKTLLAKQSVQEHEKKAWETDKNSLDSKIDSLNQRVQRGCDKVASVEESVRKLRLEIKQEKSRSESKKNALKFSISELNCNIRDLEKNKEITDRKRNNLVKELKSQIRKETVEIERLRSRNDILQGSLGVKENSTPPNSQQQVTSQTQSALPPPPRFPPPPTKAAPPSKRGKLAPRFPLSTIKPKPTDEVVTALNQKLVKKEEKNLALQQQIQYLEETVRDLNSEVDTQKNIIRDAMQETKLMALSSVGIERHIREKNQRSEISDDCSEELLSKMELVVQATSLQNVNLRKDMTAMGEKMQKLFKENHILKGDSAEGGLLG